MAKKRSWTDEELVEAVKLSTSYRMVLIKLGLIPAGGNYEQIKTAIKKLNLDVSHFTGMRWNVGLKYNLLSAVPLEDRLIPDSNFPSHKLKLKLFAVGLKQPICEMCGWAQVSEDGRTPVELDHINGNRYDNRIENLRILCPNCHSLQPTHRGRNKKVRLRKLVE